MIVIYDCDIYDCVWLFDEEQYSILIYNSNLLSENQCGSWLDTAQRRLHCKFKVC